MPGPYDLHGLHAASHALAKLDQHALAEALPGLCEALAEYREQAIEHGGGVEAMGPHRMLLLDRVIRRMPVLAAGDRYIESLVADGTICQRRWSAIDRGNHSHPTTHQISRQCRYSRDHQ